MKFIKVLFCLFLIVVSFSIINKNVLSDVDITTLSSVNSKQLFKGVIKSLKDNNTDDMNRLLINSNHNSIVLNTVSVDESSSDLLVYLYNTHNREEYKTSIYGITPKVTDVSNMIQNELLKNYVYSYVEETDTVGIVSKRGWDYPDTYTVTRENIFKVRKKYPSIKYYFDIHRDSVSGDASSCYIDEKEYARIMFVLGKGNKTYSNNLKNIKKMESYINKYYPGLLRKTYNAEYIYNQDISSNVFLVEVGGVDNSISSLFNTSSVIAEAILYLIGGVS